MKATIRIHLDHADARVLAQAILGRMAEEHSRYYGAPWGARADCGLLEQITGPLCFRWRTSGSNTLSILLLEEDGNSLLLVVEGRRHGIPWRFLTPLEGFEQSVEIVEMDSRVSLPPWETTSGEPSDPLPKDLRDRWA